jgi:ATP-dependent DNA helicase RecG
VNQRLELGEQAFIVAPAIDPSEDAGGPGALASVRELKERLERTQLAGRRLAVLHGQLSPQSRDLVMGRFRAGEIDALIATTVIEVGVDVPGATIMIVEHAERFGLAQLHQLRGRVGRGAKPSVCVLIGSPVTPEAQARLAVMAKSTDGFELAEKDLEIRGFGDVLGVRQSGMPPFKVADLTRDMDLLILARRDATEWIERSPGLESPGEVVLRRRIMKSHGKWLDLADVA